MMNRMRFFQNFPPLATHRSLGKKVNFVAQTRSGLNLPPLVIYQKLNTYDSQEDIDCAFLKLSDLYGNLKDPLKELLLQCAYEDDEKSFKVSYFDTYPVKKLPQDIYSSPPPHHMPLVKRFFSNKAAIEHKVQEVYRQDTPMATIVARWTPKSMSTQYDQKSVLRELAKFGEIESVTPFGRQTVVVTFREIRSACKAMRAFPPNGPERNMRCFWHHKFMSKYKAPKFRKTKNSATLLTMQLK
ncbi:testis expressed protein 56-like [Anolis carolinensis]|uniref:testis expressed protein 56-like n=1 Tax=Anolis carolinensis TaxID=28377 RepID=UPI002F2B2AD2